MQRRGHAVAALGELAGVVLDSFVDAGAGLGEALDVGVEGARHDRLRAASSRPAKSPARASSMVEVDMTISAISAPILALPSSIMSDSVLLALGEGGGDFAGPLDQRLVDLAGPRLERGIELLRCRCRAPRRGSGIRRSAPGRARRASSRCSCRLASNSALSVLGRAAEQRHHAGGALVEQIGQRARDVVGVVGQLGDAGVEQAGESLRPRSRSGR